MVPDQPHQRVSSQANLTFAAFANAPNSYGPSECAVASVTYPRMTAESDPRNIGFPIGCHAWVVNPNNRHEIFPIGCTGELLLEGYIAARGYLNDQEKTSQAFVTDVAWATNRSFRGYLTGDLVIQNPDGSFNIVGRKDNQVVSTGLPPDDALFLTFTSRNIMANVLSSWRSSIISTWNLRSSTTLSSCLKVGFARSDSLPSYRSRSTLLKMIRFDSSRVRKRHPYTQSWNRFVSGSQNDCPYTCYRQYGSLSTRFLSSLRENWTGSGQCSG